MSVRFWERVRNYFRGSLGPDASGPDEQRPMVQLLHPLDLLRHQVLDQAARSREESSRQEQVSSQDELRHTQLAMRAEIVALHARLNTGLTDNDLDAISASLKAHCKAFRAPRPDELNELAMLAVMARFHQEALQWAWDDFQRRLHSAGLAWPEPTGQAPHADAEEVQKHRQLHYTQLYQSFVRGPFRRFADLIVGVVPVWGAQYPEPGGAVWEETVYEAVAAALACRRLQTLESLAEREQEALERLVTQALARELAPLQSRLSAGVGSVAEARNLSDQAVAVCQQVAPEVVWQHLQTRL